jgi:hypothetical protein
MSGLPILVDGDNLLWRLPAWRAAMARDAEAARTALERRLARHRLVRVVCDGLRAGGRSADDLLVARVRALGGRALVVSDDRDLQLRVRAQGGRTCSVAEFASRYLTASERDDATDRQPAQTPQDIAAWRRVFGDTEP